MAVYELIHNFVEVLDKYFSRVVSESLNLLRNIFSLSKLGWKCHFREQIKEKYYRILINIITVREGSMSWFFREIEVYMDYKLSDKEYQKYFY